MRSSVNEYEIDLKESSTLQADHNAMLVAAIVRRGAGVRQVEMEMPASS